VVGGGFAGGARWTVDSQWLLVVLHLCCLPSGVSGGKF